MQDFYLDPDSWDLFINADGDFVTINGPDMTTQNSRFRLQIIRGEMFDDTRQGVPWLTDMVSPDVSIQAKKQILRSVIMGTPGAISVDELSMTVANDGKATVKWSGTCQGGTFSSNSVVGQLTDTEQAIAASNTWVFSGINYAETISNVVN